MQEWLRKIAPTADVTMSVCTGVEHLAKAGLLAGKSATIHHEFYDSFAKDFPGHRGQTGSSIRQRTRRSPPPEERPAGIDLALRVVDRYFGRKVAERTAVYIEHEGKGWVV